MQHLYGVQSSSNTNLCHQRTQHCQMIYKMPYQQCQLFKLQRQQKSLNLDLCIKNLIYFKPNLDMLLSALRTIKPISTESDVAGNFKTKIRSRMKFQMLNALVF
jgi:hypothetical protein